MTRRPAYVTPADVTLLAEIGRTGSVVAAARGVPMDRDRAVYRLARLSRGFGAPVVEAARGGRGHGGTQLTDLGWRLVRSGSEVTLAPLHRSRSSPRATVFEGLWRPSPRPRIVLDSGLEVVVGFRAAPGETVRAVLDPEAVLVARERFPTSARNVWEGRLRSVREIGSSGLVELTVQVRDSPVRALVTREAFRSLSLRRGAPVVLYVKATALRRIGDPATVPAIAPRRGASGSARFARERLSEP